MQVLLLWFQISQGFRAVSGVWGIRFDVGEEANMHSTFGGAVPKRMCSEGHLSLST